MNRERPRQCCFRHTDSHTCCGVFFCVGLLLRWRTRTDQLLATVNHSMMAQMGGAGGAGGMPDMGAMDGDDGPAGGDSDDDLPDLE